MYLSRLLLDARSRHVQRDLGNVHAMHQRIMSGFADARGDDSPPTNSARETSGVLYRVEVTAEGGVRVVVQSLALPSWDRLPNDYLDGDTFEPNPSHGDARRLFADVAKDKHYRFRLRANATKRVHVPGREQRGPRVELVGAQQLLAWLGRKGKEHGFALAACDAIGHEGAPLPAVRVVEEAKASGWKDSRRLTFGSTLFEGRLVVHDADALRSALQAGIGRGRAYGFGLLSIAP